MARRHVIAGVDVAGPARNLGGVSQTDQYSDVAVWSSTDGAAWSEERGLPFPGFFDEWAYAAAPFDEDLVVVGAWEDSGTTAAREQSIWTFSTDDPDGAAWLGSGIPPQWT